MQKSTVLKKLCLVYFFQKWQVLTNPKMSNRALFKNAQLDTFRFFSSNFLKINFEKIHRAYFFQQCIFLHICPLPQPIETKKLLLTIFFCGKNLLFRQNIYIYLFKKCHQFWVMTNKVIFPHKKVPF